MDEGLRFRNYLFITSFVETFNVQVVVAQKRRNRYDFPL